MRTYISHCLAICLTFICLDTYSLDLYWISNSDGVWSDGQNWSFSNGGSPAFVIPDIDDRAMFNANGTGNCILDSDVVCSGIVSADYHAGLDLNGHNFLITGTENTLLDDIHIQDISTSGSIQIITTGTVQLREVESDVAMDLTASSIYFNGGTYHGEVSATINGLANSTGTGGCIFESNLTIHNQTIDRWISLGRDLPDTYLGEVYLNNSSSSRIRMASGAIGSEFHDNIYLSNSGGGIWFGENGGSSTLMDGAGLHVGADGFDSGEVRLKRFTQSGATSQNLELTGTAILRIQEECEFQGAVHFISPRIFTHLSTYHSSCELEKTGSGSDNSAGGNIFHANTVIRHRGEDNFSFGQNYPDIFLQDLEMRNMSTGRMYLASRTPGNRVDGDLSIYMETTENKAFNYVCVQDTASLIVGGDVLIDHSAASDSLYSYIIHKGTAQIGGDLEVVNHNAALASQIILADKVGASIQVAGNCTVQNAGSGVRRRVYLANNGSVAISGELDIENSSDATESEVFVSNASTSTTTVNSDVHLLASNAACDGIYFGNSQGVTTIQNGAALNVQSPFNASRLLLRNLTSTTTDSIAVALSEASLLIVEGSTWNGHLNMEAGRTLCHHSEFLNGLYVRKTGASNDYSQGGNKIHGDLTWRSSGTESMLTANVDPDSIFGNVNLISDGSGRIQFGHSAAGTLVTGDIEVSALGQTVLISVANGNGSSVEVQGDLRLENYADNPTSTVLHLANSGQLSVAGDVDVFSHPTSPICDIYLANGANSALEIGGDLVLENEGTGNRKRMFIGNRGDISIAGDLALFNRSSASNSYMYAAHNPESVLTIDGDLMIGESVAGSQGMRFGSAGGHTVLDSSSELLIDTTLFVQGELFFKNLDQNNALSTVIELPQSATIRLIDSEWETALQVRAGRIFLIGNTFQQQVELTKTTAGNDYSGGGNEFHERVIFRNISNSVFVPGRSTPNVYHADVQYIQKGNGIIYDGINTTNVYQADVHFDIDREVRLAGGSGHVSMEGAGAQRFTAEDGSKVPMIGSLRVDKANGDVALNTSVDIMYDLELLHGVLYADENNMPMLRDNATCSAFSSTSYVQGPIRKRGNEAFTFPTGALGNLRPISISAPSSTNAEFQAEYLPVDPGSYYDREAHDPTILDLSSCEYWNLERIASGNAVFVTLSYLDETGCDLAESIDSLAVAHWNSAENKWDYFGGMNYTGDIADGTVRSEAAIDDFSPFTLAKRSFLTPLPVEMLSFSAQAAGADVALEWTTGAEINNDRFEIERTTDGMNWTTIGEVDGHGNSSSAVNYLFFDKDPQEGENYYRLKQVDFDGAFEYFGPEVVEFTSKDEFTLSNISVAPNPFRREIRLRGLPEQACVIQVLDASGRPMDRWVKSDQRSSMILDTGHLSAGMYVLSIFSEGETQTIRVIKD